MSASLGRRIFGKLMAVLLLTTIAHHKALAEGEVSATFEIKSEFFTSLWNTETVSDVESSVAQSLAAEAKFRYPFLVWQTASSSGANDSQLVLTMDDVGSGACAPTPTVILKWSGVVETKKVAIDNVNDHVLYQTCNPDIPTQDPVRLQQDIVSAVTTMLKNEDTRTKILKKVLAEIPFASEIINHENQALLLPLASSELKAGDESKMVAEFNILTESGDPLTSEIEMSPAEGPNGSVKVYVLKINRQAVPFNFQTGISMLDDALVEMIAKSMDMKIFMKEYVADHYVGETVGGTDILDEL